MQVYSYENLKDQLFTDNGQRVFLKVRDFVRKSLEISGAVRMDKAMQSGVGAGGDSWLLMACVDRLVELGEITEVNQGRNVSAQWRIFVA